jgi:hypothetical protein
MDRYRWIRWTSCVVTLSDIRLGQCSSTRSSGWTESGGRCSGSTQHSSEVSCGPLTRKNRSFTESRSNIGLANRSLRWNSRKDRNWGHTPSLQSSLSTASSQGMSNSSTFSRNTMILAHSDLRPLMRRRVAPSGISARWTDRHTVSSSDQHLWQHAGCEFQDGRSHASQCRDALV